MIYEHFNMRLHVDTASIDYDLLIADIHQNGMLSPESWVIRVGDGELNAFTVGSIVNPKPTVKKNLLDINGASGSLDMSEDNGRVFFESKTVTVILQGRADFNGMDEIEEFLSLYQGRVMDFTTDNYLNVSGYQVGRMSAEISRKNNRVTITFDNVDPYRYGATRVLNVLCRTNYELKNNADNWVSETSPYVVREDSPTHFRYSFSDVPKGVVQTRFKGVGAQPGAKMLFGIRSIVGGEVRLVSAEAENGVYKKTSKTYATIVSPDAELFPDSTGMIVMEFLVDGSYYEWVNDNGTRRYLPTIRCDYVLSDYVPIDIGGTEEIINYQGDYATLEVPSNVAIRPVVEAAAGVIICDGVAVTSPNSIRNNYRAFVYTPRLTLNGIGADRSKGKVKSVFCWVPADNSDAPNGQCKFVIIDAEVF